VSQFRWPVRVYYEDTDAGGVVYHTGYIRFMERARTEWLRAEGLSQVRLMAEDVMFSVVSLEVAFRKPARLDDLLQVVSRVSLAGGASVQFEQDILRDDGQLLAQGKVLVACIGARNFRPRRLPDILRARLT
jgi:acyl-CoA thioester hydrolase